jgi:NAD(P)-dependent dehydrogenase (short-subunit alcohol dehydrogenase family)
MVDGQGTLIVTGAAGGIGRAIAKRWTESPHPCTGLFTVRNADNVNVQPLRDILLQSDYHYSIASLELSSLTSVRSFAADINARVSSGTLPPIQALVLNAGYMSKLGQRFTEDDYEMNFQVNYLSNFLLVLSLLPSIDCEAGRIVFITSFSHDPEDPLGRLLPLRKTMWRPVHDLAKPSMPDTKYNK